MNFCCSHHHAGLRHPADLSWHIAIVKAAWLVRGPIGGTASKPGV
jgi:hypothetical protein